MCISRAHLLALLLDFPYTGGGIWPCCCCYMAPSGYGKKMGINSTLEYKSSSIQLQNKHRRAERWTALIFLRTPKPKELQQLRAL